MSEEPMADEARVRDLVRRIGEIRPDLPVIPTVFRPRPVGDVSGKRVAYVSTAPEAVLGKLARHLEEGYGCEVVAASGNLSTGGGSRRTWTDAARRGLPDGDKGRRGGRGDPARGGGGEARPLLRQRPRREGLDAGCSRSRAGRWPEGEAVVVPVGPCILGASDTSVPITVEVRSRSATFPSTSCHQRRP
jgi:hypothetical protein